MFSFNLITRRAVSHAVLGVAAFLCLSSSARPSTIFDVSGSFNSGPYSGGTFTGTYSFSLDPSQLSATSSALNVGYENLASFDVIVTKGTTMLDYDVADGSHATFSVYAAPHGEGFFEFTNSNYTQTLYLYVDLPFEGIGSFISGYPSALYNGSFSDVNQGSSFVPEPATLPLMGLTLLLGPLAFRRLRKN